MTADAPMAELERPNPERGPIPELARRGATAADTPTESDHGGAVRAMFDRISPTYDLLNRVLSAGIDGVWRRRALAELGSLPEGPILDLCAGTLDLTALAVARFPGRAVTAADFAPEMLERGRSKAPGATLVVADAQALPFENASFAAALCGFGMRNLTSPAAGVREARRVLRPGGVFVTLEFFRPVSAAARAFHKAYASYVLPAVGGIVSGDRAAYAYLARSMEGFLTRREYEGLLRDAGFGAVRGFDLFPGIASIVRAEVPR